MSQIQKAMAMLISTFHKYSGKEGDKTTLTKGELKELLNAELGDVFGKADDKAAIDKIFKDLDADGSGIVDFQEYATLVACITMICNKQFCQKWFRENDSRITIPLCLLTLISYKFCLLHSQLLHV